MISRETFKNYYDVIAQAWAEFNKGELASAKATLAPIVDSILATSPHENLDKDALVDGLPVSLQIDLAMGFTRAAERTCKFLTEREEAIRKLHVDERRKSFFYPRQVRRLFLAATGRLSEALSSVDLEESYADRDFLFEGKALRLRAELAARAANSAELLHYGNIWDAQRQSAESQSSERSAENIEEYLLLAELNIARAQFRPLFKHMLLFQARRQASMAVDLAAREGQSVSVLRGQLLLGQVAFSRGCHKKAIKILNELRETASSYDHRDLESRIALTLAKCFQHVRDVEETRSCAKVAVDLAHSRDDGPNLEPTLDSGFSILLGADESDVRSGTTASGPENVDTRPETVILVHGTHARPTWRQQQWYQRGSDFCSELDKQLRQLNSPAKCWAHLGENDREFFWSGANSWVDRRNAAVSLAAYLSKLMPYWRCHLVSHSHGGNVCHEAIRILEMSDIEPEREVRLVTLGTPFFHRRKTSTGPKFRKITQKTGKGAGCRTHSLTISSNNDEALKLIRFVLEVPEPPQLRNQQPFLTSVRAVWAESIRVARAQGKLVKVRLFRLIKALLLEVTRRRILRLAWTSVRQEICGLVGSEDDLTNIRVSPQPFGEGFPSDYSIYEYSTYEPLPTKLEAKALDERSHDLAYASKLINEFLETDHWSANSADTLLRTLTVGKLVHNFYYRNPTCIRRIARWLSAPEPNPDPIESSIFNEASHLHTLAIQDDPWGDNFINR